MDDGGDALAGFFDSLNDPQLASLTRSLRRQREQEQQQQQGGPPSGSPPSGSPPSSPRGPRRRPVVISFSHFLPFLELLPEKRFVTAPNLASVAGSAALGRRVGALEPDVHVFGHTHIPFDGRLSSLASSASASSSSAAAAAEAAGAAAARGDGEGDDGGGERPPLPPARTRFVQAPLRYPAERRRSREGRGGGSGGSPPKNSSPRSSYELQLIWDCGGTESESEGEEENDEEESEAAAAAPAKVRRGRPGPKRSAFWTEYYEEHARDPSNLELAPWVRPRVERYKNM